MDPVEQMKSVDVRSLGPDPKVSVLSCNRNERCCSRVCRPQSGTRCWTPTIVAALATNALSALWPSQPMLYGDGSPIGDPSQSRQGRSLRAPRLEAANGSVANSTSASLGSASSP